VPLRSPIQAVFARLCRRATHPAVWLPAGLVWAMLAPVKAPGQIIERHPEPTLSLLLTGEYNDNLLFQDSGAKLGALTLQATPQLEVEQGRGTLTPLLLTLEAQFARTPSQPQYHRILPVVSLSGRHEFPKSVLSFSSSYTRTSDNRREASGLIDATQKAAGLGFKGTLGAKGAYAAGLGYSSTDYHNAGYSSQSARTASLDLGRPLLAKVQLGLGLSQSWERIGVQRADSTFLNVFLADYYSPKTNFNIRVGANQRHSDFSSGAVHLGVDASVDHRWTDKTTQSLTLTHLAQADLYGRESRLLSFGYRITVVPRNFFFYYGSLRLESAAYPPYRPPVLFSTTQPGGRQTYGVAETGASYRIRSWCSVGGSYRFQTVDTSFSSRHAAQHVLRLSVNLRY
jgi:hypothetical protein